MSGRQASSSSSRRGGTGDLSIGDFRVGDVIGKGSFATVYKGFHKDGSLVAIKSVNMLKLNKKLKDNLYSEIDILKTLQHPHIVALIDCKESTTHIHVVTELCEMGDLAGFIKKRDKQHTHPATADMARKYPSTNPGGVHEVIVRSYTKQLASALKFLRDRNFIHRDVKPQNILLCPSVHYLRTLRNAPKIMSASESSLIPNAGVESLPMLKIADFGFARALPTGGLADTLCGSPLYMAPEILRYEKYDAKADLWSVGTVLYELMTGKPPFRASNHVELLRKIEQAGDQIRFPENAVVTRPMKNIIRGLLRRNPVDRMPFADFFCHEVVTGPIPGLVEDDIPKELRLPSRRSTLDADRSSRIPPSPIARPGSLLANEISQSPDPPLPPLDTHKSWRSGDHNRRSGQRSVGDEVSSKTLIDQKPERPTIDPSATAPASVQAVFKQNSYKPPPETTGRDQQLHERISQRRTVQEQQAAQDIADERDYVVVHKGAVFANSLADELAADPRLAPGVNRNQQVVTRPSRRDRSNTVPTPEPVSKAVQIVKNSKAPSHQRQNSYERRYGPSPNSATSALSKALHGASVRLYGVGVNFLKGQSPPPLYSPFPSFTHPKGNFGLIGDKPSAAPGDDEKAVHDVEEAATISDVVYCFAEVKYKQLVPWTPSTAVGSGCGGLNARSNKFGRSKLDEEAQPAAEDDEDQFEGLSLDAVITVCEEALVLYVKALSLLAKALQTASVWWDKKGRGTISTGAHSSRSSQQAALREHGARLNSAVQWSRSRFNEVLEKAEFVRMMLVESHKQLPASHPDHPSNRGSTSKTGGATASANGVHLTSGVTAEKILYERATEMCRHAAVDEIANEDLQGCEVTYTTALRLLEAVLENDDDIPGIRKRTIAQKEENESKTGEDRSLCLDKADRQVVEKMVAMIRTRLHALRKKIAIIARHQSLPPPSPRSPRCSTPTIISTPPK